MSLGGRFKCIRQKKILNSPQTKPNQKTNYFDLQEVLSVLGIMCALCVHLYVCVRERKSDSDTKQMMQAGPCALFVFSDNFYKKEQQLKTMECQRIRTLNFTVQNSGFQSERYCPPTPPLGSLWVGDTRRQQGEQRSFSLTLVIQSDLSKTPNKNEKHNHCF